MAQNFGPHAYDDYEKMLLTRAARAGVFDRTGLLPRPPFVAVIPRKTPPKARHQPVSYRKRQARHRKN